MTVEEFITLCKNKIKLYIDSNDEYDVFTIWKDFWTFGDSQDSIKYTENQRAIFSTTLSNSDYYDCLYDGDDNKLTIKIYSLDDTETYTLNNQNN